MKRLSVSALASEVGINIETVRFYESKGILPKPERTGGGHRKYSDEDIRRLKFILKAKEVGFTLNEIRTLASIRDGASNDSCDDVMELAARKITEIDQKMAALKEMRATLHELYNSCPEDTVGNCKILEGLSENT